MDKSILTILIAMSLVTGCGGSKSADTGTSSEAVESEKVITISTNNTEHTLSPRIDQDIKVTGSNNLITIATPPNLVTVTGSDNTIKIENRGKVSNLGSGNIILNLNGSSSNLN